MKKQHSRSRGFTLVELATTLAIAGVAVSVAIPSYIEFNQNNNLTTQINQFVSSINYARSEAIKRSARVVMCKSANGTSCNAGTNGWDQGWLIFVDADSDDTLDGGEAIIRVQEALSGNTILRGATSNGSFGSSTNIVTYLATGQTTEGRSNNNKLGVILCDSRADMKFSKGLRISVAGRPQVTTGDEIYSQNSNLYCS